MSADSTNRPPHRQPAAPKQAWTVREAIDDVTPTLLGMERDKSFGEVTLRFSRGMVTEWICKKNHNPRDKSKT